MLSKNKIKYINSLKLKKHRTYEKKFLIEGKKLLKEIIASDIKITTIIGKENWLQREIKNLNFSSDVEIIPAGEKDLSRISNLHTPQEAIGIAEIPTRKWPEKEISKELSLVIDNIQDPGNMGTIIRLADWFGIKNLICSKNTVDVYNPKVIQSTMGAISKVKVHYTDLTAFLSECSSTYNLEIFGTFTNGENIYKSSLPQKGLLVIGNEGSGISPELNSYFTKKLKIPDYPGNQSHSESLNVGTATAILLSEFRRRAF